MNEHFVPLRHQEQCIAAGYEVTWAWRGYDAFGSAVRSTEYLNTHE